MTTLAEAVRDLHLAYADILTSVGEWAQDEAASARALAAEETALIEWEPPRFYAIAPAEPTEGARIVDRKGRASTPMPDLDQAEVWVDALNLGVVRPGRLSWVLS